MYALARRALFALDAERAHTLTLQALVHAERIGLGTVFAGKVQQLATRCLGLEFPNPVGLAAGFDKNGEAIDALAKLGFGFIEVGTVTPKAQPGNPKPRVFRLPEAQAVINRLGFNNAGLPGLQRNLARSQFSGVLGINIGKNKDTDNADAVQDYLQCLRAVYARASYVTVNISSPNTQGLRALQGKQALTKLLGELKDAQQQLAVQHAKHTPLVLKIAPDLSDAELDDIAQVINDARIEGVIASNTTLARDGLPDGAFARESGGLSGAPLRTAATRVLAGLKQRLHKDIALIGTGGICHGADAAEKARAGATLVQFYTGMVYRGPALIAECVDAIAALRTKPSQRVAA
jgi:dihydroorotate dehydrogenase